jgi:glycosyltransferase involved in cell wall biosynthesis
MAQRLSELVQKDAFDVVHIEHLRAARLAHAIRNAPAHSGGGIPIVYDSVDCISLLFEQAVQSGAQLRSRLMTAVDLARTRRYEAQLLTRYDQVVVTSQRDKEALERLAGRYLPPGAQPAAITVVTNGVDLEYFRPGGAAPSPVPTGEGQGGGGERDGRTVVFTGKMSYHANVAAALYFAQEVLPHVWASDSSVRFQIVGKDPPEAIRRLAADERIQVTGTVDDLRPYLSGATVAVCPALYAVGIQNKVLEAMAMGAPVVSTPAGCAALAAEVGRDVLVAEGEEAFAATVLRVCSDPALAQGMAVAGRRYVEEYHSWEAGARRLVEVYEQARFETNRERI